MAAEVGKVERLDLAADPTAASQTEEKEEMVTAPVAAVDNMGPKLLVRSALAILPTGAAETEHTSSPDA